MKLGDGRKVTMHKTPACEERARLHTEASRLAAEWLTYLDDVKQTPKKDQSRQRKEMEAKDLKAKLTAARNRLSSHISEHECW
jgi:hypothetical protein